MEKTLIATNVIENPGRIAGVYQAAWRVVFGDAEGVVVHTFEWDGRDIENETLMASVTVSGHVEEEIDRGGVVRTQDQGTQFGDGQSNVGVNSHFRDSVVVDSVGAGRVGLRPPSPPCCRRAAPVNSATGAGGSFCRPVSPTCCRSVGPVNPAHRN